MPRLIHLLYALSGLLSLAYQVVWFRVYVDHFGSTTLTFALVLCNFIAGLGLGALASRWLVARVGRWTRLTDPLRIYGVVELAIAGCVLLTPLVGLLPADLLGSFPYVAVDGVYEQAPTYRGLQLALAILSVFVPCFLMGTTFPLLCAAFPADSRFPSGLYAWNTLGACSGVLLSEFLLLPLVGHDRTLFLAVGANALLGVAALRLGAARLGGGVAAGAPKPVSGGSARSGAEPESGAAEPSGRGGVGVLLSAAVLSGLVSGVLEGDAFKRVELLGLIWNAAMSFVSFWAIVGIFLGSWLVRALPGWSLGRIRVLYVLALVYHVALWRYAYDVRDALFEPDLFHVWLFVGIFVLPPFLLVSSLLPWACDRLHAGGRHLGLAYGLNTLAFCGGVLVATQVAPEVSVFYALKLTPWLLGVAVVYLFLLREDARLGALRPLAAGAGAVAVALLVPRGFDASMLAEDNPAALYPVSELRADAAHTTYVVDHPEGKLLQFDSHAMSGTNLRSQVYMRLMAHVPLLGQREPREALLICFGVGNTAAAIAAHSTIERLDVVDLSREVMATAPAFAATNDRVYQDPRLRWIHDDGRSWLAVTDERYDLITSEPPPPMNTGVYRLYSREYYEDCLEHLTRSGRMTQWLPTYQMPPEAVELAISTFVEVFPYALVFSGYENELILLGGRAPFPFDLIAFRLQQEPRVREDLRRLGIREPLQLFLRTIALEDELRRLYEGRGLISDQRNDLSHVFARSDRLAAVPFDPLAVRDGLLAREVQWPGRVQRALEDLAYLTYHVPDFPVESLLTIPSASRAEVANAAVDWRAFASERSRALGALAAGRLGEGMALLEPLLDALPEHPGLWLDRARALAAAGRFAEARVAYEEVLRLDPPNATAAGELRSLPAGG